jgi:hypothetical protein
LIFPGFDSFTDLATAMARAQREVTAVRQQGISHGDCWCGPSPDGRGVNFGEIHTVAELEERARQAGDDEEVVGTVSEIADDYERGYRFGRVYSIARPGGEWSSTHVSQMIAKLSPAQFEEARTEGWDFASLVRRGPGWISLLHRPWAYSDRRP